MTVVNASTAIHDAMKAMGLSVRTMFAGKDHDRRDGLASREKDRKLRLWSQLSRCHLAKTPPRDP